MPYYFSTILSKWRTFVENYVVVEISEGNRIKIFGFTSRYRIILHFEPCLYLKNSRFWIRKIQYIFSRRFRQLWLGTFLFFHSAISTTPSWFACSKTFEQLVGSIDFDRYWKLSKRATGSVVKISGPNGIDYTQTTEFELYSGQFNLFGKISPSL